MQLIDTHCHLDLDIFADDRHEVLARSREAGVAAFIVPGVYSNRWHNILRLCRDETDLFPALGLHPMYMDYHSEADLHELEHHASSGSLVALGEIGLDFYINKPDRHKQHTLLKKQLDIAARHHLPILLHVRKAHDQVQALLRRNQFRHGGIIHAFSGSLQQAEHYIRLGFKIGIGGTITYDRATRIRNIAATLPLDTMVLETDAPDIPPSRYHNSRNSPEYLPLILNSLAEIRKEQQATVARVTTANARRSIPTLPAH
ncbi:MAG: TatD family hydrolase [Desulfopila sp.]